MKRVYWVGSSLKDLKSLPKSIQKRIGFALYEIERGKRPLNCKTLSGFGSAKVSEIRENDSSGTYRAVYTTVIQNELYVLHVFQKKSCCGIKTSHEDIALIKKRLREVEQ